MLMVYDYHCAGCNSNFEAFVQVAECTNVLCPTCAHLADKVLSGGNFELPGHDTGFPTAAAKWARVHRQANRHNLKDMGIPV